MINNSLTGKRALITGGTSGLGRSLAYKFLERGCEVIVLGRSIDKTSASGLEAMYCDLAELSSVVDLVEQLRTQKLKFDLLVNNAGILSPPIYTETSDGFEMSYQVNFLSQVLLTRLMFKNNLLHDALVINVSSPIYTRGRIPLQENSQTNSYSILQDYANSKLFMAMFSEQLASEGLTSFSFNPGTFRSGIYRTQKDWFHHLYRVAAPFMISSRNVAEKVLQIVEKKTFRSGEIIGKNGRGKTLNHVNDMAKNRFWLNINEQLHRYF
jgi:NAD(P)-dependent dehydrogenase (short-subunit alcohol dehydrogenase family)